MRISVAALSHLQKEKVLPGLNINNAHRKCAYPRGTLFRWYLSLHRSLSPALAMDIQRGRRLEILWHVKSAPGKRSVWWGASVRSVDRPSASSACRSATVRYDALHGFNEADYNVVFLTDSLLESVESGKKRVRHMWRWPGANEPKGGDSVEGALSHPAVESVHIGKDCVAAAGTENNVGRSESESPLFTTLFERVRLLESQVLKITTGMQSSTSQERENCGRTLSLAKHKLGMELEKSLPGTTSSLSKFNDAHAVSQSVVSLQVDCTLAEFGNICKLATSVAGTNVHMHPRIPISNSSRISSSYQIVFESYADLCKLLGVSCISDVAETLLKIKAKKRSEPVSVRVIGGLKQREGISDASMILALGRSISFDASLEGPLHVLYRKSQVWDPVECAFAEPLTATTKTRSEISALFEPDDFASSSTSELNETEKSGARFELCWNRTSALSGSIFEARKNDEVLGSLNIFVPFVMFRGLSLCAEVVAACNESFLNASINQ